MASQRIKTVSVDVQGLSELSRALKAMGPEMQGELKVAARKVAEFVSRDATSAAHAIGGVAGHVAPSIRATGGVSGAGVSFGGAKYPMAGGAEFGSIRYKQFNPWRGSDSSAGYFIYPTIRRDGERIVSGFTDALDPIIKKRFPL